MSCGPRKTTGKTAALTIEVTPNQKKDILTYYANGAALALDLEQSKNTNPLPDQFFLTTSGCNQPNAPLIKSMIMLIYSMINTIGLEQNVKLNDILTETSIYRLDASYNAGNFAFGFTSNCDAASVVTIDKICPANGLLIKNYCVEKDQWGVYHDGGCGTFNQLIKTNANACGYVPPRPAGELIKLVCVDVNQWGVYTDGNYGTYRQLILEKSTDCGYVPPIPSGTLLDTECVGVDNIGIYADGNYGTYREVIEKNSGTCGYVPPIPSGTLLNTECVGADNIGIYADGNYGTYREVIEKNSGTCGYVAPPPGGIEIRRYCVEKDSWGVYTDGAGGETRELIKENSPDCGYVAPPPAGTELSRYCEEKDRYARIADGTGGSTIRLIMTNSPECGFVPINPTISLANSHSTIVVGDTETLTADFYSFEANKRYSVTWNTLSPAEFNGVATVIKTDYVQIGPSGDSINPLRLTLTDDGSRPRGIYDTWVECSSEYAVSNHVFRTFVGPPAPPPPVEPPPPPVEPPPVEPPPPSHPPSGTELSRYCEGADRYARIADGNGGFTIRLILVNSPECGFVPPSHPPSGTELSRYCEGADRYAKIADGIGGFTVRLILANSPECGYIEPPTPVTYTPTLTLTKALNNVPWFQKQTITCTLTGGDPSAAESYHVYFRYSGVTGGSYIVDAYIRPNSSGSGTATCEVGNYDSKYTTRGVYCDIPFTTIVSNTVTWVNDLPAPSPASTYEQINIKALTYVPGATVDQMHENTYLSCYFADGDNGIPGKGLVLKVPNVSNHPQIVKKDGTYEPLKWSDTDGWYTDIFTTIPRDYTLLLLI